MHLNTLLVFGSQILFKDLFRFLLVYVLFMIGYASGKQLWSFKFTVVCQHYL